MNIAVDDALVVQVGQGECDGADVVEYLRVVIEAPLAVSLPGPVLFLHVQVDVLRGLIERAFEGTW